MMPPTIYGLVEIYEKISPSKAQVDVYYNAHVIFLPDDMRESIYELDNSFSLKYDIYKTLEKSKKSMREIEDSRNIDKLTELIKSLTSEHLFEMNYYPEVAKLRVINSGKKTARNIKLLFPQLGYVEIYEEGKTLRKERMCEQILLTDLHPDNEARITYWPSGRLIDFEEIKCTYDDGRAKIIKGTQKRTKQNIFLYIFSAGLFLLILMFIVSFVGQYLESKKFKKESEHLEK